MATPPPSDGARRDPTTDELTVLAYARLKEIATGFFARVPAGHTLQPTALVHEAYLRLANAQQLAVEDYEHFVSVGTRAMRQILVDHYRRSAAGKRGGGHLRVTLHDFAAPGTDTHVDVAALDAAIHALEALNPRQARVVELRFFGASRCRRSPARPTSRSPLPSASGAAPARGSAFASTNPRARREHVVGATSRHPTARRADAPLRRPLRPLGTQPAPRHRAAPPDRRCAGRRARTVARGRST